MVKNNTNQAKQTNQIKENHISTFSSDKDGNWNMELSTDLEPGMHTVVAQDEYGNTDHFLLYIQEPNTTHTTACKQCPSQKQTQQQSNKFLENYWWLLILALLLINIFLLTKLRNKKKRKLLSKNKKRILIITLIIILIGGGYFLNKKLNIISKTKSPTTKEQISNIYKPSFNKITGRIINPITMKGVKDIDLTVGENTIHTDEGGHYIFNSIKNNTGIQINSQKLTRSILKLFEKTSNMDIYFNANLLNTLIEIVNLESTNEYTAIYNKLSKKTKEKIDKNKFISTYKDNFTLKNLSDQLLKIEKIETKKDSKKTIEITILSNTKKDKYLFSYIENKWTLIGKNGIIYGQSKISTK